MRRKIVLHRRKQYRIVLFLALVAFSLFINVGLASLSTDISMEGTISVAKATWQIDLSTPIIDASSTDQTVPTITSENGTVTLNASNINLLAPGDTYMFTTTITNNGSIPAELNSIVLPTSLPEYLDYTISYDGVVANKTTTASTFKEYLITNNKIALPTTTNKTLVVTITYVDGLDPEVYPTEISATNLSFSFNYIQP